MFGLPNLITFSRIVLLAPLLYCLFQKTPQMDLWAVFIFILASLSDWLDGYLARSTQSITNLGKLLDPLADKFLVTSTLIMLLYVDRLHPLLVILLICREIAITGLRAMASSEGIVLAASPTAKWKTGTQMVALPLLILGNRGNLPFFRIGQWLIYVSLIISFWSARDYWLGFFRGLRRRRKP